MTKTPNVFYERNPGIQDKKDKKQHQLHPQPIPTKTKETRRIPKQELALR